MKWNLPQLGRWRDFLVQYRYVILMVLVGLFLLLLPQEESVPATAETATEGGTLYSVEVLEERLAEALSQIEGAGETQVLLTLADEGQRILAQNTEQNGDSRDVVTVTDANRGETVVELQSISPSFRGALVVCQGGNDPVVQLKLVNAVGVLTGLSSDKISICAASGAAN